METFSFPSLPHDWKAFLQKEIEQPYFEHLRQFVSEEYATKECFPPQKQIFRAFELCPLCHVKVVLLGQDPYHEPGQAQGLCFSVGDGVKWPPSLRNIFKELNNDLHLPLPESGDLSNWARQGVLLLNTTLTVRHHEANSHAGKGWEKFTDAVIRLVSQHQPHVVFLLWGGPAQKKISLVDETKHLILQSAHPSPLSAYRGFFGNHHFNKTNEYLSKMGLEPINWSER